MSDVPRHTVEAGSNKDSSQTGQPQSVPQDRTEPDYIIEQPGQHGLGDKLSDLKSDAQPHPATNGLDETDASAIHPEVIAADLSKHHADGAKQTVYVPTTPHTHEPTSSRSRRASALDLAGMHSPQQSNMASSHYQGHSRSASILPEFINKRLSDLKFAFNDDDAASTTSYQSQQHDDIGSPGPPPVNRQRLASYVPSFPQQKYATEARPIEEHGLIGNMKTCSLIGTDAELTWFCHPHFDSPSIFGSILDIEKGGYWRIRSAVEANENLYGEPVVHKQLYHSETNVLITRFLTETGVAQVQDYMPVGQQCKFADGWLVREIEVVRGKMYFEVEIKPAFNYAQDDHTIELTSHGARFVSKSLTMILSSHRRYKYLLTNDGKGVLVKIKLSEGQKTVFIFREEKPDEHDSSSHPGVSSQVRSRFDCDSNTYTPGNTQRKVASTTELTDVLRKSTIDYWRSWLSKCTYKGRWREAIYRSALVLKLLTFEPTGAIVAAPTTSLPESLGNERNWDYRFTWIRDSSFVLYAFIKLGFRDEARAFMKWIEQRCREATEKGKTGELQIMYGLHGEHELKEISLEHLAGYRDSRPVRVGNGAYNQFQMDIYGELLDTVYLSNKYAEPVSYDFWCHIRVMVDWVTKNWTRKDEGIWEVRGGQQHFIYSKVMAWVAIDRGIRLAERRSFPADLPRWHAVRNEIFEDVQLKGWSEKRQAYVQYYGCDTLDASNLIMPLVFFISPTDPRFKSTLDNILKSVADDGLVSNNLVFRYNVDQTNDGLSGEEGTFSMCTFWAVEAASRLGQYDKEYLEKARLMFEQMLGYANHLGLYSEEIGRRGEHLGNFPQAFTHLSLISAAINLDRSLDVWRTRS